MFGRNKKKQAAGQPLSQAEEAKAAGRAAEALEICGRTILQTGDLNLMDTVEHWLSDRSFLAQAGEAAVCRWIAFLTPVLDRVEQPRQQRLWEACLQVLRSLTDTKPRHDTTDRYTAECILLRHMQKSEEALEVAQTGLEKHASASCATFAGLCCIDLGKIAQAESYIRQGVALNPDNLSGCNDMADYFFNERCYEKALEYYSMVAETGDPYDRQWAVPSLIFCQYMQSEDPMDVERLVLYAAAQAENERAQRLCELVRWERRIPYVEYLPDIADACVKMIPSFCEKDVTEGTMGLSCQEAASGINAVRLAMSQFGKRQANLHIAVTHIPNPPLDQVLIPEGARLWTYRIDNDAQAAKQPPAPELAQAIRNIAQSPFHLQSWYEQAKAVAADIDEQTIEGLYGCMVHPPAPQVEIPADQWVLRVQFAAACALAQAGRAHLSAESPQMKHYTEVLPSPQLVRICLGQLDWPVIPALTLLVWQAEQGIAKADAVMEVMGQLLTRVPRNDYCFFEHALVCALSRMPEQDEEFKASMRCRRREIESY